MLDISSFFLVFSTILTIERRISNPFERRLLYIGFCGTISLSKGAPGTSNAILCDLLAPRSVGRILALYAMYSKNLYSNSTKIKTVNI